MMRVELDRATGSLSDYARKARRAPVVILRRGRPVAVLRALTDQDWEDLVVSTHPGFVALMRRSFERFKAGAGIPLEQIERELGVATKDAPQRRRRRRQGRART
jgi:hypothetical protein